MQQLQDRRQPASTRDVHECLALAAHVPSPARLQEEYAASRHTRRHHLPQSVLRGRRANGDSVTYKVAPESTALVNHLNHLERQKFLSSALFFSPMSVNEGVRSSMVCAMLALFALARFVRTAQTRRGTPSSWRPLPRWSHPNCPRDHPDTHPRTHGGPLLHR